MAELEIGREVLVTLSRGALATGRVTSQVEPGRYVVTFQMFGVPREIFVSSDGAGGWTDHAGRKVEISARR